MLGAEGPDSGLAGQLSARADRPGTYYMLGFGPGLDEAGGRVVGGPPVRPHAIALLAELDRPGASLVAAADLPSSGAANRAVFELNAERNAKEKLARQRREAAQKLAENAGMANAGIENTMSVQPEAPPATTTQHGPTPSSRSSPNSAAPRTSTATTEPTTAPRPPPSSPAVR
jgi:hypothetical protein